MESWHWFIIGIAALALEIFLVTGFYLFILGVAAIFVGVVATLGLLTSWESQSLVFAVAAVVFWILFAGRLQRLMRRQEQEVSGVVGQTAKAIETIAPGHKGGGELWGSSWKLENVGEGIIAAGSECLVVGNEGITLKVKGKN
jgi:membrane protein implicated in regulation of membrane protease activity